MTAKVRRGKPSREIEGGHDLPALPPPLTWRKRPLPMNAHTKEPLVPARNRLMANAIRALAMDAVEAAKSGHPGMPMGMADAATVLFSRFLKFDPANPHWPDRDRFVLSAGHGSMLLYALLHLTGYADFPLDELKRFRKLGSKCAGHPEYGHGAGVETTTGPLGQGIATAVGMALAERMMAARFGNALVDHRTYVIASDGDLMEGVSHEAISLAGHLKLSRLIVLFDDNGISIDGALSLSESGDQLKRFEAAGWRAERVDGHDPEAVAAALERAQGSDRPSLIACRTRIGFGAPTKEGSEKSHGSPLGAAEVEGARKNLDWPHAPFVVPDDIRAMWRIVGARNQAAFADWTRRLDASPARDSFNAALAASLDALAKPMSEYISSLIAKPQNVATRKASEMALEVINAAIPATIGGSADLTGSNNTLTKGMGIVKPGDFAGRFIHYGVREHGMAAAMNGMALHGGFIPYSGTFLAFADYCRPSLRLAALMGVRVIHVMTHDSIGLGEDGPTHQPVEHLASLRAIPNLYVFRPCDAVETAECWQAALALSQSPSVLALTRQNLAQARLTPAAENLSARGAYILREASSAPGVVLIATGSEVEIALAARELLEAEGIAARVVSAPCFELFAAQQTSWRNDVLPPSVPRVAIEAASHMGWDQLGVSAEDFVGMTGFGASAPHTDLYRHFGLTADAVALKARAAIARNSARKGAL